MPGATHGPGEQTVGFGIVNELLLRGVPSDWPAQFIRDIAQMANRNGPGADGYWGAGLAACLDGFDKVGMMVLGLVKMQLIRADLLALQVLWPGLEIVPPYGHLAFGPHEHNTVAACIRALAAKPVRISHQDSPVPIMVCQDLYLASVGRDYFDRATVVHSQSPLADVEVMRAPVGHLATGKVPISHPAAHIRGIVWTPRRRSKPHVVVEIIGHRLGG